MVKFSSGKTIVFPPTNEFLSTLTIEELSELYKIGRVCGNLDQNSFFDVKSKTGLYERRYAVINYYFAKHYLELDKSLLVAKKFRKSLSEEFGIFGRTLSKAYEYVGKRHDEFVEIGGRTVEDFRQYLLMNSQERKKSFVRRYAFLYDEYLTAFSDFSKESFVDLDSDDLLFERNALNTIDKNANLFLTYLNNFQDQAICSDVLKKMKKVFHTEKVDKKHLVRYFFAVYFRNRCLGNVGFEINPQDYLQVLQYVLSDGKLSRCRAISETEAASDIKSIYLKFRDDKKFQDTFQKYFPSGFSKITISFVEFCYQAFRDLKSINSTLGKNMVLEEFLFLNDSSKGQLLRDVDDKKQKDLTDFVDKCQREIDEETRKQNELNRQLEESQRRFSESLNRSSAGYLDRILKTQLQYENMVREKDREEWLSETLRTLVTKYPNMDSSILYYDIQSFVQLYERKIGKVFDYGNPPVTIAEIESFCLMSESERIAFEEETNFFENNSSESKK